MDAEAAWGIALRPLATFLLLLALAPIVWAVRRYMKDGKLKRLLLFRVNAESESGSGNGQSPSA